MKVIHKISAQYAKSHRRKVRKTVCFQYSNSKRGITPTKLMQIDDTRIWSVVKYNKGGCKISAQYVKACGRKVRKSVYFQYYQFQKGRNSYKVNSFIQMISLSMHLLPRVNIMLDFICMGPADLPGAHGKRQNTKWKIIAHRGTQSHNLEICSLMLYRQS